MKRIICVDLDGVLAQYDEWKGLEHIGEPIDGARDFLIALCANTFEILIYTTRTNPAVNTEESKYDLALRIHNWLAENKMPYHGVYVGPGKPIALAYIDDRAVSCVPRKEGTKDDNREIYRQAYKQVISLAE